LWEVSWTKLRELLKEGGIPLAKMVEKKAGEVITKASTES